MLCTPTTPEKKSSQPGKSENKKMVQPQNTTKGGGGPDLITMLAFSISRSNDSGSVTLTSCTVMRGLPALRICPCSIKLVPERVQNPTAAHTHLYSKTTHSWSDSTRQKPMKTHKPITISNSLFSHRVSIAGAATNPEPNTTTRFEL